MGVDIVNFGRQGSIMSFQFVTSCVNAPSGDDINEMVDSPHRKDISNGHFIKVIAPNLGIQDDVMGSLGYETKKFFANDWAMSCHKSYYQGIPCYYVQHSRIEHIYIDEKDINKVIYDKEGSSKRSFAIERLEDEFLEIVQGAGCKTKREEYKLANSFYLQHKEEMNEKRILMAHLYHDKGLTDVLVSLDKKVVIPDLTFSEFRKDANLIELGS